MSKKQEQALQVTDITEVKQEQFAALIVFGDDESGGKGLSISAAGRRMGISASAATHWWQSRVVQDYVREQLDTIKNEARLKASAHHEKAINTLVAALDSPAYTTPQVNAAKALLQFAYGDKDTANAVAGIVVNVGTGLPDDVLAQQQRRHSQQRVREVATDGDFKETPVE